MTEQLLSGQTSSIGAVWPPRVDGVHNRLRGFYTDSVVQTPEQIDAFAASFDAQRMLAQTIEGVDRLTIRVVAQSEALPALEAMGIPVEAAIPLARTEPGLVVAYTAVNQPGRSMSAQHLAYHRETLATATAHRQAARVHGASLASRGFSVHTVQPEDAEKLTPQFMNLYAAFSYDSAEVTEILGSASNTIAYVRDGDRTTIVSTAMAERASVAIAGLGELSLVEITEASTDPAYRGQGLYRSVSGALAEGLLADTSINALYGESNLAMHGVLRAAHENGRRFSHHDDHGVQNPAYGILQQNFHVADGTETRRYNDFAVSYYPLG